MTPRQRIRLTAPKSRSASAVLRFENTAVFLFSFRNVTFDWGLEPCRLLSQEDRPLPWGRGCQWVNGGRLGQRGEGRVPRTLLSVCHLE